jgi:hypothetical protein
MLADSKALYVFENESASFEFGDDTHEFEDEAVTRILQGPMADERETLAGRTAEHAVYLMIADACHAADKVGVYPLHREWNDCCIREIKFVNGAVYGIDLDGGGNVEAGLLEAEA